MIGSPSAGLSRFLEASVERGCDQRVKLDRRAFDQDWLEGLDAQAVQSRRPIQEDGAFPDDTFQRFPDFGTIALDETARALHVGSVVVLNKACDHEWTIKLK